MNHSGIRKEANRKQSEKAWEPVAEISDSCAVMNDTGAAGRGEEPQEPLSTQYYYNVLVTDWDSSNVEDILMPCMFEDLYRMDTGEILRPENGEIPAEVYERIMTTYFPVTKERIREICGYRADTDSYPYEMIFSSPYPPFGEVVGDKENPDGTLTLFVDGVWPDYNSDRAFTNIITVQPFDDGTFRYLSNSIEKKELDIPNVYDMK